MAGKYYWLKLQKDFFKRHDIRIIEGMPNGKDYILFYLKLLVESVSHEGELRFSDTIPYNEEMLAVVTNTNVDIVRHAMQVFTQLQMIDILEDSTIYMSEVNKMIGSEGESARRMREKRAADKALLQCAHNVQHSDIEKEIDIELDKEKEVSNKAKRFIKPTLEQIQQHIQDKGYKVNADTFFNYYQSNGWKVGRNPMKSWEACLAQWNSREKEKQPKNGGKGSSRKYDYAALENELL